MTSTTKQATPNQGTAKRRREWLAEHATAYVFATVNGHYEVHVVRRAAGAWAVRLGGFALHRDGCFWTAPDHPAEHQTGGGEPTYPLDEAITRTLHVLARLP